MKIFKNKHSLQKEILKQKSIIFVPTMGGLHKGHISLIKRSKSFNGKSLVSIFVNPKQFNNKKDFITYPKNIKKDLIILKKLGIDYVYLPTVKDIYNFKPKLKVFLHNFSKELCGKTRKGHFEGVLNVVNRLLQIIKPKYLLLGLKDFQQLFLIDKHIKKNKLKTNIIKCKIIREKSGIVCSTRNQKLSVSEIANASKIYRYLLNKKRSRELKTEEMIKEIMRLGASKIDYIKVINLKTLKRPINKQKFRIFIAYFIKKVRIIDNV